MLRYTRYEILMVMCMRGAVFWDDLVGRNCFGQLALILLAKEISYMAVGCKNPKPCPTTDSYNLHLLCIVNVSLSALVFNSNKTGKGVLYNVVHKIANSFLWGLLILLKNESNEMQSVKVSCIKFQQNLLVYGTHRKCYAWASTNSMEQFMEYIEKPMYGLM
jgi:hypothetical protein